jgi:hypothetical protein
LGKALLARISSISSATFSHWDLVSATNWIFSIRMRSRMRRASSAGIFDGGRMSISAGHPAHSTPSSWTIFIL